MAFSDDIRPHPDAAARCGWIIGFDVNHLSDPAVFFKHVGVKGEDELSGLSRCEFGWCN
jgi:hypothetical protein